MYSEVLAQYDTQNETKNEPVIRLQTQQPGNVHSNYDW